MPLLANPRPVARLVATAVVAPPGALVALALGSLPTHREVHALAFAVLATWIVALGIWNARGARTTAQKVPLLLAGLATAFVSICAVAYLFLLVNCDGGTCLS